MAQIVFSLTPSSTELTGGKKLWHANVQTNGTVTASTLAKDLATKTHQDVPTAQYFLSALNEELKDQMVLGNRVNLGQLATGFAIRGSFENADDRFDATRHTLVATINAIGALKDALAGIVPTNVLAHLTCSIGSLMDAVTKELNAVTGTDEIHIEGENLWINTANEDEGVWFLDPETGDVKGTCTVTASDPQTITCKLPAKIADGTYTVKVASRNGNRDSFAPAVATLKNVIVKEA